MNQNVEGDMLHEGAVLTDGAAQLLETARSKRHQSQHRAETVLRVARTIAELALSERIEAERVEAEHAAEGLGLQRGAKDRER